MQFSSLFACALICGLITRAKLIHRENVARNKTAKQSSTMKYNGYNWVADFVLDDNVNYNDNCKCCSITTGNEKPWLEIDLGTIHNIGRIDVYGRPNVTYQLREFKVYIGESSINSETSHPIYLNVATKYEYLLAHGHFTIILTNVSAQYIRIMDESLLTDHMVICEIKVFEACEDFQFEPDCSPCNCYASPCDKSTGLCPSFCMPGWQGPSCNISCNDGTYGINCLEECRCLNPETCDTVTGACTDGNCVFGWKGIYCNISTLISDGKTVKMSSQFEDWKAERAVDGDITTRADSCRCCAATKYSNFPWFEIDLGMPFRIAHIIIYGRTDQKEAIQSFNGLRIFAEKHENVNVNGNQLFFSTKTKYFLNITLDMPIITQYITLRQARYRLMVICELQLFEGECDDGQFGRLCNETCYCLGQPCDKETGECPSTKCLPGYQGNTCSKECDDGRFGNGCNGTCGFCLNSTACDNVQGNCTSCEPGYKGQRCNQPCDDGKFGLNCSSDCGNCKDAETCDHVTGHCPHECQPGYVEPFCNEGCDFGKYGHLCADDCGHCANNQTCNITNGHCGDIGCAEDYIQPLCVTRTKQESEESFALSTGQLAAILCGLLVLLVVLIVAVVLYRRRVQKETSCSADCDIDNEADKDKNTSVDVVPDIPVKDTPTIQKHAEFPTVEHPEEIEYYAFAPRKDDIKIHQIWDYIHKGMQNNCKLFNDEFESLKKGLQYECKAATEGTNRPKNRYKDIYAYDANRVKLSPLAIDQSEGDYINASFVDGYEKVAKFIASQGPTKEMVNDFWRMIRQQQCNVIVMLTNVYELGVLKCLQYWPLDEEPMTFGNIVVKLLKEETHADYVLRYLEIDDYDNCREIKQYHFTSWPDKTTPDTAWSLVNFWRVVTAATTTVSRPIVVHCSAGVGRTGTFIALDNLCHQATSEGCIRPLQMVETLRKQRVNMVQTKEQYVYVHEAVAEALLIGTHFIKADQFDDVYTHLMKIADGESKTNMEKQFDLIEMSLRDSQSAEDGENPDKNTEVSKQKEKNHTEKEYEIESVYSNVSDVDVFDSHQTTDTDETDKLLKTYLLDYKDEPSFLVLPVPNNAETLKDFIEVVVTAHVKTIIQLKDETESAITLVNGDKVEDFEVNVLKETETEGWTDKELSLTYTKKQLVATETMNIRQFVLYDWKSEENIPKTSKEFFNFLLEIQLWQPLISKKTPIVLINSKSKRHGLLYVVLNELTRMTSDDNVNMVETMKKIRQQDRAFISDFVQYKFCYDTIKNAVQQNELYENL